MVCHLDVNTSLALHHINTVPLQIKRRNHKILCFQKDVPSTFKSAISQYGKKFEHHSLKTRGAELGSLVMLASLFLLSSLKEGRDAWCLSPVWNLRAIVWFHSSLSSLVCLPTPVALSVLSFFPLMAHSSDFLQELRYSLFSVPLVQQLEDSWSVVCALCRYKALVFAVTHLCNSFFSFCLLLLYN